VRIIATKRQKAFILEKVKNPIHHDGGRTFRIIRNTLTAELGYVIFWKVIDASAYVPQHRERIIIIGFRGDLYSDSQFTFHVQQAHVSALNSILDQNPGPKYTLSDRLWEYLQNYAKKQRAKGNGFGYGLVDPAKDRITRTVLKS
jgi:DNA (cytosine-5)-methyltransferase 1